MIGLKHLGMESFYTTITQLSISNFQKAICLLFCIFRSIPTAIPMGKSLFFMSFKFRKVFLKAKGNLLRRLKDMYREKRRGLQLKQQLQDWESRKQLMDEPGFQPFRRGYQSDVRLTI